MEFARSLRLCRHKIVTDLDLESCGTDLDKVFHRGRQAGLGAKSSREVCHCWDVLQIWRDWFHEKFGELKFVRHRSGGDDSPDLELLFVRKTVAFEDTRLQPEHIGRADALRNRKIAPDICTTVPAISKSTKSSKKLIETMLGIPQGAGCANVSDEHAALTSLLAETVRKKMDRLPNGAIIGIVGETAYTGHTLEFLFQAAEHLIRSEEFCDFDNYVLIIKSRSNAIQYNCALITRQDGRIIRTTRPAS